MSDQSLSVTLAIKNFGQTPAYKFTVSMGVDVAPFPLTTALPPAEIQQIKSANIGPDGIQTVNFDRRPVPVGRRAGFAQKIVAVYVHGTITYDTFDIPRFTNFRLYKGGDAGESGPRLHVAIDGNDAD